MNGIYFRDILLTRISRGANNCGQHPLEKNIYFIMRFSPHFQLFYFNDRLEFCEFFEGKIKRINNADLFSQLPLLIFIKGANISGGHCICADLSFFMAVLDVRLFVLGVPRNLQLWIRMWEHKAVPLISSIIFIKVTQRLFSKSFACTSTVASVKIFTSWQGRKSRGGPLWGGQDPPI